MMANGFIGTWEAMISICKERDVNPAILTYPEQYRDEISAVRRANVLRELNNRFGFKAGNLTGICPMTERNINLILSGGRELAFKKQQNGGKS